MRTAKIRFNDTTYLVQILSVTEDGTVTVAYPDGDAERIYSEDWNRYLQAQADFEEEQKNG